MRTSALRKTISEKIGLIPETLQIYRNGKDAIKFQLDYVGIMVELLWSTLTLSSFKGDVAKMIAEELVERHPRLPLRKVT